MPVELKGSNWFPCMCGRPVPTQPRTRRTTAVGQRGVLSRTTTQAGRPLLSYPSLPHLHPGTSRRHRLCHVPAFHGAVPTSTTHRQHRNLSRSPVSPLKTNKYPPTMLPRCFASLASTRPQSPRVSRIHESPESASPESYHKMTPLAPTTARRARRRDGVLTRA